MNRQRLELADIVRQHGHEYAARFNPGSAKRKVLRAITICRTASLGGHRYRCSDCGAEEQSYNSCRNRHCPKCLGGKTARWMKAREAELLPVPYFHCVFTLPHVFNALTLGNKTVVYDLLFRAASETLRQAAKNPKHLGADIGFFGILHTWGQKLNFHPHIHFVIPAGGLSPDRTRWIHPANPSFFAPVRVLQLLFRAKFLDYLNAAFKKGQLRCDSFTFRNVCRQSTQSNWIVYCKPPFTGPACVLKYLSRYTHRVAISNSRLVSLQNGLVSFRYRDYAAGGKRKVSAISAVEFLRRFLLHLVPKRFTRIRHFGVFATRGRNSMLALAKRLLPGATISAEPPRRSAPICPVCSHDSLVLTMVVPPGSCRSPAPLTFPIDSRSNAPPHLSNTRIPFNIAF